MTTKKQKTNRYTVLLLCLVSCGLATAGLWWLANNTQTYSSNVVRDDLARAFNNASTEGTMAIKDLGAKQTTVVNLARSKKAYLPSSTFKIPHSLIALEERAVASPDEIIKGPHVPLYVSGKSFLPEACQKNISFKEAYRNSCANIYQEIARKIPKSTYQRYLQQMQYGNEYIATAPVDEFWLQGDFATTPKQQLDFLEKLYKEELPFSSDTMKAVKAMMLSEEAADYKIRAKTGWVFSTDPHVGWWTGWVEKGDRVTFFALNMDLKKAELAPARVPIGKEILKQLDVF